MSNLEDDIFDDIYPYGRDQVTAAALAADDDTHIQEPDPVKQIIILRTDLGMTPGKAAAQAAHASISWLTTRLRDSNCCLSYLSEAEDLWINGAFTKIVLQVPDAIQLGQYHRWALAADLESHLIIDSGKTVFDGVPTATAVAIGPDFSERINEVTSGLRLYY